MFHFFGFFWIFKANPYFFMFSGEKVDFLYFLLYNLLWGKDEKQ